MTKAKSTQRVTIDDVARLAGFSIATVSRVINQNYPVSEETAKRVKAAIKELNYVPQQAARQLAKRRTGMLGLVLDEIGGDFFSPMLRGIEAGAREAGYNLLIATTQGTSSTGVIGEHNTDGMLVFNDCLTDEELRQFHATGFPMVLMYRSPIPGLDIPCVAFKNKQGAYHMTSHLIERCQFTQIVFLAGPEGNEDSYWRELGYREALEAHGIPFNPDLILVGGFDDHEAEAAVEHLLSTGIHPEAIFAGDDESAIGAIQALRHAGLRIPEDVAVVGFDDLPIARYLSPPLTTVRAPIESTGYEATRQLVDLVENGRAEPFILLPTELIIRESCGCKRTD